jgi:hypothetical protein
LHNTFEEERLKHKQIVFFLLAERKKIVMKYIEERKRSEDLGQVMPIFLTTIINVIVLFYLFNHYY